MKRPCLFALLGLSLQACDPDGPGRPITEPAGTDTLTAPIVAIDPPAPRSGDDLLALVQVPAESTVDGAISYTIAWLRDGEEQVEASGLERLPAALTSVGESWSLQVVSEVDGLVSELAVDEVLIGNSAPALELELSPATPLTDDDLATSVSGEDPDGDELELTYAWYRDGALSEHSDPSLPAEATARDEQWLVRVLGLDPSGAAAEAWGSVTIGNSAPSVLGAVISPQPLFATDGAACTAVGFSDPDDDVAANVYAWTRNGALVAGAEGELLDAGTAVWGDVLVCEVTAADDLEVGNTVVSQEVELGNSAPSAPEIVIWPESPVAGQPLEAHFLRHAEDPDGYPVTYSFYWTRGGLYYGDIQLVYGGDVIAGDSWEVQVTASDGDLDSETVTASVTVPE